MTKLPTKRDTDPSKEFRIVEGHAALNRCPFCGFAAQLWQRHENADIWLTAVMCSNSGDDDPTEDECPAYMPPECFYHQTKREAVAYWQKRTAPPSPEHRETGWLVEALHAKPPLWAADITISGTTWTQDANCALRFSRREDAEKLAGHVTHFEGRWIIAPTEHVWCER